MRAYNGRQLIASIGLTLAVASSAVAQTPATFCDVKVANQAPNGDVLHPGAVYAAFKGQIDRNEWGQIARALEDDFRKSTAPIPATDRSSFARQLKAVVDQMTAVETSGNVADLVAKAKGVNQVRFNIETNVVDGGYFIFAIPDRITIAVNADDAVAKELCYRAHAVRKLLVRYGETARDSTVNALGHYISLWDNYNSKGYSQYPWELWLNGLWTVKPGGLTPPSSQWVIAHPALAIEVAAPSSNDLRQLQIVTFEPIGYLRYRRDRKSYGGLSLLVTLSASADPGYGALLHLGRIGKLGYVYHRRKEATARHGAVFSIDLYKMIAGVPQQLQDAKKRVEALRDEAVAPVK